MTSTIKVDNIQDQDGNNIINESSNTITVGASGDTIIIPSGATITNNGTQNGFGRTGTVDWDTSNIKTATFTAVSGDGFFANTTGGAFTMNLPAGSAGAIVSVADYAGTWDSNNLTVSPNGSDKIGGTSANVILNTLGQSVTFVFVDSTQGWVNVQDSTSNERGSNFLTATGGTITTCGNDKIHTFTGPGTFTVSQVSSCAPENIVSYMVIAGGGGAGHSYPTSNGGGGGGAGGYREIKNPVTPYTASPLDGFGTPANQVTVTASAFPITVGGGGPGHTPSGAGTAGSPSIFSTITSAGGGKGGANGPGSGSPSNPTTGGSGGGGAGGTSCASLGGGSAGNTPPTTPAQGNAGGDNYKVGTGSPPDNPAAGGGGAGAAAPDAPTGAGGNGGAGVTTSIDGTPTTRGGGGAGGGSPNGTGGTGGGGGTGQLNATDNTGGGGGGTMNGTNGGNGGSGIVIIRYKFQ